MPSSQAASCSARPRPSSTQQMRTPSRGSSARARISRCASGQGTAQNRCEVPNSPSSRASSSASSWPSSSQACSVVRVDAFHGEPPSVDPRRGGATLGNDPARGRTGSVDAMEVFDRRAVRRHRDRAARTVAVWPMCCAMPRNGCSIGWTTRRSALPQALDVGGRGVVAPLLRARGIEVVSCDLSPAMAAVNGGLAVAADEEFLPFGAGQFRPGGGEPVAALGERPAGRADPVAPGAAAGRAAAGEPAGAGHVSANCARR